MTKKPAGKGLATAALVLSILGVLVICVPLSLLALPLALVARGKAARAGQEAPRRALIAVALALVGLVTSVTAYVALHRKGTQTRAQAEAVKARVAGPRTAATIELDTACTLAEAALLQAGTPAGKVRCSLVEVSADRMMVDATTERAGRAKATRSCLRRGRRWFVVGFDGRCSASPLSPGLDALSVEAQERKWCDEEDDRLFQDDVSAAARLVEGLRARPPGPASPCNAVKGPGKGELLTIDGSALEGGARLVDWQFLTSDELLPFLDEKSTPGDRVEAFTDARGAAVAVVWPDKLVPPQVVRSGSGAGKHSYVSGSFRGEVLLVDGASGEVRCRVPLAFGNRSRTDVVSLSSADDARRAENTREALIRDLREQFLLNLGTALAKQGAPVAPMLDGAGRAFAIEWSR